MAFVSSSFANKKLQDRRYTNNTVPITGEAFTSVLDINANEVYTDVNGNIKIRKNEADKAAKVDGIIALIIAAHCSLDNPFVSNSFGFRSFQM